jgi:hypothetical protein
VDSELRLFGSVQRQDASHRAAHGPGRHHLRAKLKELYPDIAAGIHCTRQGLSMFVELSAGCCIRDDGDVAETS